MYVSYGAISALKVRFVLGLFQYSVPLGVHIYAIRADLSADHSVADTGNCEICDAWVHLGCGCSL